MSVMPGVSHTNDSIYQSSLSVRSFRLLQIELTSPVLPSETEIKCSLQTFPLADAPAYFALSYTWGDAEDSDGGNLPPGFNESWVLLNGHRMQIPNNLRHALLELCSRKPGTYWWIDALCINQQDIAERTTQVSIMQDIFRNAEKVFVWLGPDWTGEATMVREFLRALLQKYVDDQLDKYEPEWLNRDDENVLEAEGLPPLQHPIWTTIVRFWDRRWFSRVWVRQEVAVARAVEVWCGRTEFTLQELIEASRFHALSGLGNTLLLLKSEDPRKSVSGRRIGCSAVGFETLQEWVGATTLGEADDFKSAMDRLTGPASSDKHPLLRMFADMLFLTFRDEASDKKDKVFVPLVLMKRIAESYNVPEIPLSIDYSQSADEVYREATLWVIKESRCLGILSLLKPDRTLPTLSHIPSWVPDYTGAPFTHLRMFTEDDLYHADASQSSFDYKINFSLQDSSLRVMGKYCGSIRDIGDKKKSMIDDGCFELSARVLLNCPTTMSHGRNRLETWRKTMCGESTDASPSIQEDSCRDFNHWLAFYVLRKIVMDYNDGRIKSGREHLAKMSSFELLAETDNSKMLPDWAFWQHLTTDGERANQILRHRPRFETVELGGRCLFRTDQPVYLGIGPQAMLLEDEVWIIAGAAMPLVLRPVKSSLPGCPKTASYLVVGESYINDIGHILDNLRLEEWQKLELQ